MRAILLGEILVREGLITVDQLESALKAQVLYGGRLGTNLVEANALDLDQLAHGLALRLQVPPAFEKHFKQIDPAVVSLLPAKLAAKHSAVPLGVLMKPAKTLYVAFIEPTPVAADEVAFASGCRVVATVAPELRVYFFLEKLYRIARKTRYLRVHGPPPPATPPGGERRRYVEELTDQSVLMGALIGAVEDASGGLDATEMLEAAAANPTGVTQKSATPARTTAGASSALPAPAQAPSGQTPVSENTAAASTAGALSHAAAPTHAGAGVSSTSAAPSAHSGASGGGAAVLSTAAAPSPVSSAQASAGGAPPHAPAGHANLTAQPSNPAAISLEAVPGSFAPLPSDSLPPGAATAPPAEDSPLIEAELILDPAPAAPQRPAINISQAVATVSAAPHRDQVGDAIVDYLRSAYDIGLVFIVRNEVATFWKGFATGVEKRVLETIAIPLSAPSTLRQAIDRRAPLRAGPSPETAPIQGLVYSVLRCTPPAEVLAAPVLLKDRAVLLVYAHAPGGAVLPDSALADAASLCATTTTALARLIQVGKTASS